MDLYRFDALTRALARRDSRRGAAALLGSVFATPLITTHPVIAKKKKKVTLCHEGQTLSVSKKAKKAHLNHGDALGPCPAPPPPPPPPPNPPPPPAGTCDDEVKNGSESDVDCGGSCQRCENGKACKGRNDCAGAFCANETCLECASSGQCGADAHGNCACEPTIDGPKACNSIAPGIEKPACDQCPAGMNCIDAGSLVLCVLPCGAS